MEYFTVPLIAKISITVKLMNQDANGFAEKEREELDTITIDQIVTGRIVG